MDLGGQIERQRVDSDGDLTVISERHMMVCLRVDVVHQFGWYRRS